MSIFEDTDTINAFLSQMADNGMAEPIDEPNAHPLDWAEAVGLWDEVIDSMYAEPTVMVDEDDFVWYVS